MTTAADITALQAASAQAVKDLNSLATTQAALAAAQAQITQLTADKASLTTANAALTSQVVAYQGQVSDLTTRLAGAEADLAPLKAQITAYQAQVAALRPDAARWQKARMPDPTTYDQFFKDGGITSTALSAADADAAMDLAIAGKTPAGTFLGMYSMSVVKP